MEKFKKLVVTCCNGMEVSYTNGTLGFSEDGTQMVIQTEEGNVDAYILSNVVCYSVEEEKG